MRGICLRASCSFASPGIRIINDLNGLWGDERPLGVVGRVGEGGLKRGVRVIGDENEGGAAFSPIDDFGPSSLVEEAPSSVKTRKGLVGWGCEGSMYVEAAVEAAAGVEVGCWDRLTKSGWPLGGCEGGAAAAGALVLPIVMTGVGFISEEASPLSAMSGAECRSSAGCELETAANEEAECRVGVRPAEGVEFDLMKPRAPCFSRSDGSAVRRLAPLIDLFRGLSWGALAAAPPLLLLCEKRSKSREIAPDPETPDWFAFADIGLLELSAEILLMRLRVLGGWGWRLLVFEEDERVTLLAAFLE
jgi:hypothetical protein